MAETPFLFLDRSLGRVQVPAILRSGGLSLVTLAEHYGQPADETIDDPDWITEAAGRGWVLLMKDARIRRRPAERQAIIDSRARCFCLSDGNLLAGEMAQRYLKHWQRIAELSTTPGPFLYSVRANDLVRLVLD